MSDLKWTTTRQEITVGDPVGAGGAVCGAHFDPEFGAWDLDMRFRAHARTPEEGLAALAEQCRQFLAEVGEPVPEPVPAACPSTPPHTDGIRCTGPEGHRGAHVAWSTTGAPAFWGVSARGALDRWLAAERGKPEPTPPQHPSGGCEVTYRGCGLERCSGPAGHAGSHVAWVSAGALVFDAGDAEWVLAASAARRSTPCNCRLPGPGGNKPPCPEHGRSGRRSE